MITDRSFQEHVLTCYVKAMAAVYGHVKDEALKTGEQDINASMAAFEVAEELQLKKHIDKTLKALNA